MTPVKNQGNCGSCWAQTVAEMIEAHKALKTGHLVSLSAQQIVSCAKNPYYCGGTGGCKGAIF